MLILSFFLHQLVGKELKERLEDAFSTRWGPSIFLSAVLEEVFGHLGLEPGKWSQIKIKVKKKKKTTKIRRDREMEGSCLEVKGQPDVLYKGRKVTNKLH